MTSNSQNTADESQLLSDLLEPLFYFDIFSYPLTSSEIHTFSQLEEANLPLERMELVLQKLVDNKYLYKIEDFYLLHDKAEWVTIRKSNNKRAKDFMAKARRMTRMMSYFPYVRAVFISGSLSKNVMPEDGDIDYFIVTKPGRLWITRTCLILFKKIFLLNSHKYFCVNYFVDEECLEIEEKNRFTATEIVTLLPMYGEKAYQDFLQANTWVKNFYPNKKPRNHHTIVRQRPTWTQNIIEGLLNHSTGDRIDTFFMNKTIKYWQKKFHNFDPEQFSVALKSRRNVSKHHPQQFQRKVINAFQERVESFEKKHSVSLKINK